MQVYVGDLFPRPVKRKGGPSGQVVEFPRCHKYLIPDPPVQTLEYRNLEEGCEKPNTVDENEKDRQPEPLARGDRGLVHPLRPLASSSVRGPRLEGDVEADVVSSLVHSSMRQYAVISVRSEKGCERLVIEYPDEKASAIL